MVAGLVRALLDILLHPAAVAGQMAAVVSLSLIVGGAALIQTHTFSPCLPRQAVDMALVVVPVATSSRGRKLLAVSLHPHLRQPMVIAAGLAVAWSGH